MNAKHTPGPWRWEVSRKSRPSSSATCVECARLARLSRRRPFCCELTSRVIASPPRTLRRIGVSEQAVCSCGAYVFAAAVEAETQRLLSWRSP